MSVVCWSCFSADVRSADDVIAFEGPIAVSTSFLVNDFIKGSLTAPSTDDEFA